MASLMVLLVADSKLIWILISTFLSDLQLYNYRLNIMEDSIKVLILNEEKTLTKNDFFLTTPLIDTHQISQLKSVFLCLDGSSIKALHIFIYYIIKVNKNLQIKGLQQHLQKELGSYYLQNELKINIMQFAIVCSKVLTMKVEECAHIIFYLIYGRLATSSYIDAIFKNQGYISRKQKIKANTSMKNFKLKDSKNWQKSSEEETFNEVDQLQMDLRQILKPSKSQTRPKIVKNIRLNDISKQNVSHNAKIIKVPNSKYFNIFFPNRVSNFEKSALIQAKTEKGVKKCKFLRKKRFNDHYVTKIKKKKIDTKDISLSSTKQIFSEALQKQSKLNTQNFSQIIDQIRNSSSYLDQIRMSIEDNQKKLKRKINEKYINNYMSTDEYDFTHKKKQQNKENNQKKDERKEQKAQEPEGRNTYVNLLQKNTVMNTSKNDQNNGNSTGFLSFTKKQNILFKFKSEYRKFLKNQLFQSYGD